MTETLKNWFDAAFITAAIATVAELIPLIIGGLSIAWGVYRLYDLHLSIQLKKKQLKE